MRFIHLSLIAQKFGLQPLTRLHSIAVIMVGITYRLLSPERAALGETGLATGWLAENLRAAGADNDGLCVREDGGDGEAARALDVHEE